jgi:hypothetical protein
LSQLAEPPRRGIAATSGLAANRGIIRSGHIA